MEPILHTAGNREAGALCPHCGNEVVSGEPVAKCRACGMVHHQTCWEGKGCGAYSCAPARRQYDGATPLWQISPDELQRIVPIPSNPRPIAGGGYRPPLLPQKPRVSRMAVASLCCAVAGIAMFGLITGLVAVVLAILALGEISRTRRTGKWMAYSGMFVGLGAAGLWVFFLMHILDFGGVHHSGGPRATDFKLDPAHLDAMPATISRAMRANVLLTVHRALGTHIGSGIILNIADGQARILTNRHVVDPDFNSDSVADPGSLSAVDVAMIDQSQSQGKVVWIAPDGVDLAVVSAPCVTKAVRATAWPATRPSVIGDSVFAIGNPQQWGWTQAQGFLSQFRTLSTGGHDVSVIQSSAPIAPGNSGGGLYDRDGFLIGINTWVSENGATLSLSISLDTFLQLSPLEFKPNTKAVEPRQKETSHP